MSQDFPLVQEMETEDGDTNDPDHHRAEAIVCIQVLCAQFLINYLHLKKIVQRQ